MIGIFGLFQKFQKFWLFWFWFLQKFLVLKTQRIFEKFSDIERPESLKDRENRKAEIFFPTNCLFGDYFDKENLNCKKKLIL